ncbi:MAG: AI-2E family transporter [Prolixibacteraceae bacterium]|nr:AI-2E family transporter [Prolixibacteraceae bacterium]
MNINTRTRNILLIIGAVIFLAIAWFFRSIVAYILISAIMAMIGRPLVRWLRKVKVWKIKFSPSISALIALIALWALFFTFFRFMIPLLASEFKDLANVDIDTYIKQLEEPVNQISKIIWGKEYSINKEEFISLAGSKISSFFKVSQITDIFGTIAGTIGELLIGLFSVSFITFFFLRDEKMFKDGLMLLTPVEYEERVSKSLDRISYLLRRYFIGLMLEILMVMALDTIGLTIVGLDFGDAVVIGLFCGLFNVIPYLGPWLGAFVGLLIGLALNINADFMSHTLPTLGFMTIVFASVQVIDNILFQPLIYSSSVKAHPLEIFLIIIAAGSIAGILGMILAIPVYTILRVFGAEFFSNIKLVRKLTENIDKVDKKKGKAT